MAVLHVGDVVSIRGTGAMVHVPFVAPGFVFGPLEMLYSARAGDRVIVGQLEGAPEDLVVMGKVDAFVSPYTYIYFFETATERDAVFDGTPMDMSSPTFAWVDDDLKLYVWTDETNAWRQVSWDEARIAAIEAVNASQSSSIATNASDISALATRTTNLEGLAVSDTSTIDLTLSGSSWPKTLSASFILNSITLDNLSGVVVSGSTAGQMLRHNGSNYVNTFVNLDDLADVDATSPSGKPVLRWNPSTSKWEAYDQISRGPAGGSYYTGGLTMGSTGTEVALAAWTDSDATVFENNRIYEATVVCGVAETSLGTFHLGTVRVRKTVNSTTSQLLMTFRADLPANNGAFVLQRTAVGYVKNVS